MSAVDAVVIDRADILTQAEKLPQWTAQRGSERGTHWANDLISLSDLRNLIEGK